jgi:regulator of protease activity HflC (stomatin/prohibitin superfamily)
MEAETIGLLAIAGVVTLVATIVGYRTQGTIGALLLGAGVALAAGLALAGGLAGQTVGGTVSGPAGLAIGVALGAAVLWVFGNRIVRGQSGRFAAGLWVGLCTFCAVGYAAGEWIGLLTITLPAVVVFWISLYRTAAYILPLRGKSQRRQAFRSLLTFTMGTNYPYYLIRDGRVEKRLDGNPYGQFFSGPGLVFVDCDQAGYLTDGIKVKGVLESGLNFTSMFDREPKALDLRPQLRALDVKAVTRDGMAVQSRAFVAFRIAPGNQPPGPDGTSTPQEVKLGKPFPLRRRSVHQIAIQEPAGKAEHAQKAGERFDWATDFVPQLVTRAFQDSISHYSLDELCAALEPNRQPCQEVAGRLSQGLRDPLRRIGVELLEVWTSELSPEDQTITKRRIANWKTEWERQILSLISEGRAEYARQIEQARADAELKILRRFGQVAQSSHLGDAASQTALALRFIDCLGEIVSETESQWPLPEDLRESLQQLRGEIQEGQR